MIGEKQKCSLVSVIIPAYNAEKCIEACINSVLNQTYEFYEIILINDGSKDKTREICEELSYKHKKIKFINSENQGVSGARNLGLEAAAGQYIFFMDSDDRIFPDTLESLLEKANDTEWMIGNFMLFNEKNRIGEPNCLFYKEKIYVGEVNELPELVKSRTFHFVWGKLYCHDIIRKYQLSFDTSYNYGEDLLFNVNYFVHISKFMIKRKAVYEYHYHTDSGLSNSVKWDEWEIQKKLCTEIKGILEKSPNLKDSTKEQMNHFYYSQCIASLERVILLKDKNKIKEILSSQFFKEILLQERRTGRIKFIDYLLLKQQFGKTYYRLHKMYAAIKKMRGR